jgi:AcrR family transcriptional regulator
METAEAMFADCGFDGVSLRDLTARAKVNLAAVNYYFGSKERLYTDIVQRRIRPLNEGRLSLLGQAVASAGERPPPLEEILEILIRPALAAHGDPARGGAPIVRLQARCLSDPPNTFLHQEVTEEFQLTLGRFAQALRRHVPHLSPEEFLWRFNFVVGALQHTLANLHQMAALTRGICRSDDYEYAASRFVKCAAAILRS